MTGQENKVVRITYLGIEDKVSAVVFCIIKCINRPTGLPLKSRCIIYIYYSLS